MVDIVEYLNKKLNSNYKSNTASTQKHINARLSEGFVFKDFKQVIDKKYDEWYNDEKMRVYLRPETLFGSKFESYLNSPRKIKQGVNSNFEDLDKFYDNLIRGDLDV